jgi:hypothetical protein
MSYHVTSGTRPKLAFKLISSRVPGRRIHKEKARAGTARQRRLVPASLKSRRGDKPSDGPSPPLWLGRYLMSGPDVEAFAGLDE